MRNSLFNGALTGLVTCFLVTMPAAAQSQKSSPADQRFVTEAAIGGMTEVQVGKLAQEKSSSDAVKQFGQKLEQDHSKANDQLKEIAGKDGLSVPDSLDAKHKSMVDKLSALSGSAFDKAFISNAVKDHEEDIKVFQKEAQNGGNADVKSFASQTIPTLQDHLMMAKNLKASGGTSNSSSAKQ